LIEADHYDIIYELTILTEQSIIQKPTKNSIFWHNATKYASTSSDESFVEEVAYMMVTLHRTGA
jgi:hypothetical protein|tara:strand:- start:84 stop:275 length:192 start_codon:yes stop_codon:yes gene_type:complete